MCACRRSLSFWQMSYIWWHYGFLKNGPFPSFFILNHVTKHRHTQHIWHNWMSIWLLLFFHYTQLFGSTSYSPWPGPDCIWCIVLLNLLHITIMSMLLWFPPLLLWLTWFSSSLSLGLIFVSQLMNLCVLCIDCIKHHGLLAHCPGCNQWLCSAFGNLVPHVLFDHHWGVPHILSVLHDYSASFHHSQSVG